MADQLDLFAVRSKARKPRSAKGKTIDPKPQGALGAFPKPEPKNRRAVPPGAPSARLYVFPVAREPWRGTADMADPGQDLDDQFAGLDQAAARILGTATVAVEATAVATLVVRAVVSLLEERGILPAADVQERALMIARGAGMPPAIVAAIGQLLDASAPLTVPPGAALN